MGREWEGMKGGRNKRREAERDSGRRENVGGWREGGGRECGRG